jgi:hypothetical protein
MHGVKRLLCREGIKTEEDEGKIKRGEKNRRKVRKKEEK